MNRVLVILLGFSLISGCKDEEEVLISVEEYLTLNNITNFETANSGLKYIIYSAGEGEFPTTADIVSFDYTVTKTNDAIVWTSEGGVPFDLNYGLGIMIPGLEEGLALLKPGGSATFYIPSDLAYGTSGSRDGSIAPNEDIIFEVSVTGISFRPSSIEEYLIINELIDYEVASNGLHYKIDLLGEGDFPTNGQTVMVHYTGTFLDGIKFDSSHDRGETFSVTIGESPVISGFEQGIKLLKTGGKTTVLIPYALGYGEFGSDSIPPKTDLIFEIELVEIVN